MRITLYAIMLAALFAGSGYYMSHPELWPGTTTVIDVTAALPDTPAPAAADTRPENAPASPVTDAAPAAAGQLPAPTPGPQAQGGAEHIAERACTAPPTRAVSETSVAKIYRWKDANGRLQFSDKPPAGQRAGTYDAGIKPRKKYFASTVTFTGRQDIPFLHDRLKVQVDKIYAGLAGLIGQERLRAVELNVKVFEDLVAYNAYAMDISPGLRNTAGFYQVKLNEAVTYQHDSNASTMATARHEATHVIVAGLFGDTPPWLNEGLAEYYESLRVEGQRTVVKPQAQWHRVVGDALDAGYPARISEYLLLERQQWYGENRQIHYALAWALVHFLMSSDPGRLALAAYLKDLADNYCSEVNRLAWLDNYAPGGVGAFERDFRRWMLNSRLSAHVY